MSVTEYRTTDKVKWGDGPWQAEADKVSWTDEATGLPCLIVRGPHGGLCGYVGVHADHPAHGQGYDHHRWGEDGEEPLTSTQTAINDLSVHGGLTYANGCAHGADPAYGICHIPEPGEPDDVWWFGFNCAHAGDYSPAHDWRYPSEHSRIGAPTGWGTFIAYRDRAYVEEQISSLASQLKSIKDLA